MVDLSIIIPVYNTEQFLPRCIDSCLELDIDSKTYEIIIVDDGSTDGTKQAINELFPNVTVIEGTGNLFWARGTSLAWQEALKSKEKFDYYLWLNDDTYLINTAIEELLKTQRNATEIINGSACDPVTKRRTYGGTKFTSKFLRPFRYKVIDVNGEPQEVDTVNGNVLLVPHSVYIKIGAIDNVFEHAFADVEYSLRARRNGITILLTAKHVAECERKTLDYEAYLKLSLFAITFSQVLSTIDVLRDLSFLVLFLATATSLEVSTNTI